MLFPREMLYRLSYYSEVLSDYAKQYEGSEWNEVWNGWSLIVPLLWTKIIFHMFTLKDIFVEGSQLHVFCFCFCFCFCFFHWPQSTVALKANSNFQRLVMFSFFLNLFTYLFYFYHFILSIYFSYCFLYLLFLWTLVIDISVSSMWDNYKSSKFTKYLSELGIIKTIE